MVAFMLIFRLVPVYYLEKIFFAVRLELTLYDISR